MQIQRTLISCGAREAHGLYDGLTIPKMVAKLAKEAKHSEAFPSGRPPGFIVWSDRTDYIEDDGYNRTRKLGMGEKLAKEMERVYGGVTKIGPRRNPNTGHQIALWVWEIPSPLKKKVAEEEKPKPISRPRMSSFLRYDRF